MKWKKTAALSYATVFSALSLATGVYAAPANPDSFEVSQPSGEAFEMKQNGDEWFNWQTSGDGDVLIKDKKGFWNYAILEDNKLQASGSKYKIDKKCDNCISDKELRKWVKEYKPHEKKKKEWKKEREADQVKLKAGVTELRGEGVTADAALTGTKKLLVLLVDFNDVTIQNTDSTWSNRFFGTSVGTVRNYFNEVSNGRLTIAPAAETGGLGDDGVIRVKLNYNHPNTGSQFTQANKDIVTNALNAADPYVNFASFDADGDGDVEKDELYIVTVTAGYEASYSASYTPNLWGHHWYTASSTRDGKIISGEYVQQAELHGDHMATMGILCHELGHSMTLPDLYDTDGSSAGVGGHSLMGAGSWGRAAGQYSGQSPTHLDAWSKQFLGFVDPTVITAEGNYTYTLNAAPGAYNTVKINAGTTSGEYFLLENRQFNGYDAGLTRTVTGSGGIAIWHIDDAITTNANDTHRKVDVEESNEAALGYSQIDTDVATGYDHYFYLGKVNEWSQYTTPNSNLYSGNKTGVKVTVNSTSGNAMSVNIFYDKTAPSAPSNLTAASDSASTITLNWSGATDNTGVTGYRIYRDGGVVATVTGTSYTDTGLVMNQTYSYQIMAIDGADNHSFLSNQVQMVTQGSTVDIIAPTAPTNVTVSPIYANKLNISWTASTDNIGVTEYIIYDGNGNQIGTTTRTIFGHTPLIPDTTYYYQVKAKDAAGNLSPASAIVSGKTNPDTTAPTDPSNLNATAVSANQINLSWTAGTDDIGITEYIIYNSTTSTEIGRTTATSFAHTGLKPNIGYFYRVKAKDAAGNLSPGNQVFSAYTPADTAPPTAPGNLTATTVSTSQIDLKWTAATDGTGVYQYVIYDSTGKQIGLTNYMVFSYSAKGLTPGVTHTFQVKAKDEAGNLSVASTASATTIADYTIPSTPGNLTATPFSYRQIDLKWTPSTDNTAVKEYVIYTNSGIQLGTSTTNTFSHMGLTGSTTYSYLVKARDTAGNLSLASNIATATTPVTSTDMTAPTSPTGLSAKAVSGNQITLYWTEGTDNVGVTGYLIYNSGTLVGTTQTPFFAHYNLTPNTGYYYQVKTRDAAGNLSIGSTVVSAVTPSTIIDAPPMRPGNLTAKGISTNQIQINWIASTDDVGVTEYQVYESGVLIGTVSSTTTTFTQTVPNTWYRYYQVKAKDTAGNISEGSNVAKAQPILP
ncbi:M6 family metalloprotease domain-containing protein [Brevibacillus dissolubilis]|uniref:M6 family metalloprotease domain-containing protein n=1 Tax=Brevibacillus dissolubilis TaxID=1844116 RepID=UPI001116B184|nr:M6 family metalloprotease domain-containing protein [Brevibacillus dissolubilis]